MKRKKLWKLVTGQTLHCSNSRAIDYVSTVLTDTSLLSIVSAFYKPGLVRILTLKATWLHDHAVLVERHRRAVVLQLRGYERDWSEVVQDASGHSRAVDYVSTVLTDTSLLSIVSAFYNPGLVRILTSKATWLHDRAFLVKIHRRALSIRQAACEHDWSEVVDFASKLEIAFATGRLSAWPGELATIWEVLDPSGIHIWYRVALRDMSGSVLLGIPQRCALVPAGS